MIRRSLQVIGSHPIAGSWLVAQLLILVWVAVALIFGRGSGLFVVLIAIVTLQLPASFAVGAVLRVITLGTHLDDREEAFLLIWQCVISGCANYLFWICAGPRISKRMEARWPFERAYFRRPSSPYNRMQGNNELRRTRPAQAIEPRPLNSALGRTRETR